MDYQKALKKFTLFFLSNPVPFNGQNYQKQKGSGTSDKSHFRLQKKFKNIPLFVIYHLTKFDDVMLLVYSKNYICKFMQVNWWHQKLFHFHWSLRILKLWRGREKIIKIWIFWERKVFIVFIVFIVHSFHNS